MHWHNDALKGRAAEGARDSRGPQRRPNARHAVHELRVQPQQGGHQGRRGQQAALPGGGVLDQAQLHTHQGAGDARLQASHASHASKLWF